MKLNQSPRINSDPAIKREFVEHANQVNALAEGRIVGTYNAQTAAPTTGTHAKGDLIRNSAPADSGAAGNKHSIYGWLCVAGGTPGTWVEARFMTDDVTGGGGGVSDADYGDITVSGAGTVWTIDSGAVTLAKQANVATATVFYRKTGGAGAPEVQTLATLKTDLGLTGTNSGDQTPGGSTTQVQFNDAGAFGGDADFTWNKTTNTLSIGAAAATGTLRAPDSGASAVGGALALLAGTPASGNATGGAVSLTSGAGIGNGNGGAVSIVSGAGGSTSIAGNISITGGVNGNLGVGGAINITGGQTNSGNGGAHGGAITLTGGLAGPTNGDVGGAINLVGGASGTNGGLGGPVNITSGVGGANTSGAITIKTANATGGNRSTGNVILQAGTPAGSGTRGNIQLDGGNGAALATTATGGFVTIPTCAGTPTGVPANVPTGSVALVYDTTNNKVYNYNAGWITGSGGSPGGSTTEVQFNNAGAFDGNPNLTFNDSTGVLTMAVDAVINGCGAGRGLANEVTNTRFGNAALAATTSGVRNTSFGNGAGTAITDGIDNTSFGYRALYTNNVGGYNTAVGSYAMGTGSAAFGTSSCVAIGYNALNGVTNGANNTAVGRDALLVLATGQHNTALGFTALDSATGSNNTAVGSGALGNATSGSNNLGVGYIAGTEAGVRNITTASNEIAMGNNAHTAAYIKIAWTVTSDQRDKCNISAVPHGLDFVCGLSPVAYSMRVSRGSNVPSGRVRYGFLAQDVLSIEGGYPVVVDNTDAEHLKINETAIIPILVNAIQELRLQVEQLRAGN